MAHVVDLHRTEGPGTDVEHDLGALHAARREPRQEQLREVQTRGRCGDAAGLARVDGLVALAIRWSVLAADVGGQRRVAEALERLVFADPVRNEAHRAHDGLGAGRCVVRQRLVRGVGLDEDAQAGADLDAHPRAQAPAGPQHRVPDPAAAAPHQQDLGLAAALAAPDEARREDAAAVRDQQVAGAQALRQLREAPVLDGARAAVEHQKPRGVARGERRLRDELGGERVLVGRELEVGVGSLIGGSAPGRASGGS